MWQPPGRPFFFLFSADQQKAKRPSLAVGHIHTSFQNDGPLKSCQNVPTVSRVDVAMEVLISTPLGVDQSRGCDELAALTTLTSQVLDVGWN